MTLTLLIIFCVLFPLTHIVLSHGSIRNGLVTALRGAWPFRGFYSLVSFATLGGAIYIYWGNRHLGAVLWDLPRIVELVVALPLMLFAMVLLLLSLATPSPASMIPGTTDPRGVLRITRHPMNIGFALFGLVHLVANGAVGDIFFFGQFLVVGVVGAYHMDARKVREKGEAYIEFKRQTSVMPFLAILRGRNKLEAGELAFPMFVIGVAAFVALVVFHGKLFGVDLF
jgi:uncharacterized membrane protein